MKTYTYFVHDDDNRILDKEFDNFVDAYDYAQTGLITSITETPVIDGIPQYEDEEVIWTWDDTWDREKAINMITARHEFEEACAEHPEECDEDIKLDLHAEASPEEVAKLADMIFGTDLDLEFPEPVEKVEVAEVEAPEFDFSEEPANDLNFDEDKYLDHDFNEPVNEGYNNDEFYRLLAATKKLGIETAGDLDKFSEEHGNVKDQALLAELEKAAAEVEESLDEDTHNKYAKPEGDRRASYNNALKYANKYNKPYCYGYTNTRLNNKFFAFEQPFVWNFKDDEFRAQYKNCGTIFVAYPGKPVMESLGTKQVTRLVTEADFEEENPIALGYNCDDSDVMFVGDEVYSDTMYYAFFDGTKYALYNWLEGDDGTDEEGYMYDEFDTLEELNDAISTINFEEVLFESEMSDLELAKKLEEAKNLKEGIIFSDDAERLQIKELLNTDKEYILNRLQAGRTSGDAMGFGSAPRRLSKEELEQLKDEWILVEESGGIIYATFEKPVNEIRALLGLEPQDALGNPLKVENLDEAKKDDDELPPDPEVVKLEVHQQLNDLVADEIQAINQYEDVKADIIDKPVEHKDDIVDTINHIEDEEKEHIDELVDVTTEIPFEKEHEEVHQVEEIKEEPVHEEEFNENLKEAALTSNFIKQMIDADEKALAEVEDEETKAFLKKRLEILHRDFDSLSKAEQRVLEKEQK